MSNKRHFVTIGLSEVIVFCLALALCNGCRTGDGYSNESMYREGVRCVYVEMFDNQSFRRGIEYEFTDALVKRIEVQTPYKVVSERDLADTLLSGQIVSVNKTSLVIERQTGRAMENELIAGAVVNWKNLRTGELLIDSEVVSAGASFSQWQEQGEAYASALLSNKLAREVVELMEKEW